MTKLVPGGAVPNTGRESDAPGFRPPAGPGRMTRRRILIRLGVFTAACFWFLTAAASVPDGYLLQKIGFLIYSDFGDDRFPAGAEWILRREIRSFESFLWSKSDRRVYVDSVVLNPGRELASNEFLDAGPRWGFLPDFSTRVDADLRAAGWSRGDFDILILLYEPPPERDTPLAGATYLPPDLSAIPLRRETFLQAGRRHPLHRLLVHEYLHQVEFLFSGVHHDAYLIDPDTAEWETCSVGVGDELQVALRRNATCQDVEWFLLSPDAGIWVIR